MLLPHALTLAQAVHTRASRAGADLFIIIANADTVISPSNASLVAEVLPGRRDTS